MPSKTTQKPKNTEPVTPAPEQEQSQSPENQATDLPPAAESPAVVPPTDMDETEELLTKHIRCTDTGVIVEGDLPLEKWAKGFEFFQKIGSKTQWWRGDMLVYGERKYGESYAQAVDIHGKSESRLQTYVSVALKFPMERRRPELSFDHHAECSSLEAREADALLLRAIRERWTKMDVRAETARINERNGVPKRGRKPGSTAAKVAASGKTPQIPEGEKPLIWNGYPLRVGKPYEGANERIVFQGNEPLEDAETERAAHENKFAHKEAMMNWLEEHHFIKTEGGESECATKSLPADAVTDTPILNASSTTSVASNGAAPNATESAPTPKDALSDAVEFAASKSHGETPMPDGATYEKMMGHINQLIHERDDARDQLKRYDAHAAALTPLQRAEEALLTFAAAAQEVNWEEIGTNKLLKAKWIERLLLPCDETIDRLQKVAPTSRK